MTDAVKWALIREFRPRLMVNAGSIWMQTDLIPRGLNGYGAIDGADPDEALEKLALWCITQTADRLRDERGGSWVSATTEEVSP